ncbi:serine/threonine-protein kinase [Arenimonas composti]|uniref:Protein kinase domain-containing protein n=1 Tax=Arenimonas composti TR7-09 = DSM 18010 TaxID=1121013 RepID=A0A091BHK9_9GAMM|nr:serine/threonine-protein kinase [Arenimonas composti]KFN51246.1 hypothetical protein P873_02995 [Arenimonas composti TR7-09 = DSM 18010]
MSQPETPRISGYTLLRVLGQGGMAVVYHATQDSLGREVALKVMSADLARDPGYAERFLREGRVVASLRHRNILMVYDLGVTEENRPWLAMEYVPGGAVAEEAGRMARREVLKVIRDIARALDHAHSQGVIHRDIKPENILRGADGDYLLADFGIARVREATSALTMEGSTLGTPQYMSPEQWRGEPLDGRTDLYSLGVVLYQLLTGQLPYTGTDGWAIGMQHMTSALPALPPEHAQVQPLLDMMLAKIPSQRFATGNALANAAESLLNSLPPVPTPRPMAAAATAVMPTPVPGARQPTPMPGQRPPTPAPAPRHPTPPPRHPTPPPHSPQSSPQPHYPPQPAYTPVRTQVRPPAKSGPSTGLIIGGILAVVAVLVLAAGGIGWYVYSKGKEEAQALLAGGTSGGGDVASPAPPSTPADVPVERPRAPAGGTPIAGNAPNASSADPQVRAQLDRLGIDYEIDGDNDFQVLFETRNGRTQLGWIRSPVESYGRHRVREIWSYGYVAQGNEIPVDIANRMLEHANLQKLGGWVRQGQYGVFVVQVSANATDAQLAEAIRICLATADGFEQELTGAADQL